jgi:hypothetical protein
VSKDKRLKLLAPKDQKLGRPTIMDRALAQRHGTPYVHAAVFAIDIDRLREHEEERGELPFAWEVYLTECYVARFLASEANVHVLEDLCLHVLELPRPKGSEPGPLGTQLAFAVYAGVAHGRLPAALGECFRVWKKPPTDLLEELAKLRADSELLLKLVDFALDADLTPPLAPPVREALLKLAEGTGE